MTRNFFLGGATMGGVAGAVVMLVAACGDDAVAPPVVATQDAGAADTRTRDPETPDTGDGARRFSAGTCGAARFSARWGGGLREGLAGAGDTASALALDAEGNLYLTGWFRGDADFGGGPVDAGGTNPSLVVLKLGPERAPVWSRTFGDPRATAITVPFTRGLAAAVHPAGGVVIGGNFAGQLHPGAGASLSSTGGCTTGIGDCEADAFVIRLDPAGTRVFAVRFGSFGRDSVRSVAIDGAGDVVAAGTFQGTVDFGGGGLASAGDTDVFVARLDPLTGAHRGSFRLGGAGAETLGGLAVLPGGDLVVGGAFAGRLTLGATTLTAPGDYDAFVARLSPTGTVRWVKALRATKQAQVRAVTADGAGNLYVAGAFDGTIDLGGSKTAVRIDDAFVAKLDGEGAVSWARTWGGDANDRASAIAVDANGAVLVTGETDSIDGIDYGGGKIGGGLNGSAFVVDLDRDGAHRCSRVFATTAVVPPDATVGFALATAETVALVGTDGVAIGGSFGGKIDFGKGEHEAAGGLDMYAAELGR